MKFNTTHDQEIKKLLKSKNINYRYYKLYGFFYYDYRSETTFIGIKKYNHILDYEVGYIKGEVENEIL